MVDYSINLARTSPFADVTAHEITFLFRSFTLNRKYLPLFRKQNCFSCYKAVFNKDAYRISHKRHVCLYIRHNWIVWNLVFLGGKLFPIHFLFLSHSNCWHSWNHGKPRSGHFLLAWHAMLESLATLLTFPETMSKNIFVSQY